METYKQMTAFIFSAWRGLSISYCQTVVTAVNILEMLLLLLSVASRHLSALNFLYKQICLLYCILFAQWTFGDISMNRSNKSTAIITIFTVPTRGGHNVYYWNWILCPKLTQQWTWQCTVCSDRNRFEMYVLHLTGRCSGRALRSSRFESRPG
jgi:hypothetical protein